MSYLDVGYNEYLEKSSDTGEISAIDNDSVTQEGGLTASKLTGDLNPKQIGAGTYQLTGDDAIKFTDENDEDILTIDKNGLTIIKGKISIKDKNNNEIISSGGLLNNIQSGNVEYSGTASIGTSLTPLNATNTSINLKTKSNLFIFLSINVYMINSVDEAFIEIYIDGKKYPTYGNSQSAAIQVSVDKEASNDYSTTTCHYMKNLDKGNHNFYFAVKNSANTFQYSGYTMSYIAIPTNS